MNLQQNIAQLLTKHNCVIVPEFGGFIGNYKSAVVNHSLLLVYPPAKQVLFNPNLKQNDGLLANQIMIDQQISYNQAVEVIRTQVEEWKKELNNGERIEFGEMGFLFLQNNSILFEQDKTHNLLLQSYGLNAVSFIDFSKLKSVVDQTSILKRTQENKPLIKVKKPEYSADVNTDEPILDQEKETPVIQLDSTTKITVNKPKKENKPTLPVTKKKKKKYYKYAAAAILVPALFYSYWIPMQTDFLNSGKIQISDLNPFQKRNTPVYTNREQSIIKEETLDWKSWDELTASLPDNIMFYNYELSEDTYIPVNLNRKIVPAGTLFHVIAGCFSIENNARNFVAELQSKGYDAALLDKNKGLFRVSAGGFNNENEAKSALKNFKNQGFSGWILKP